MKSQSFKQPGDGTPEAWNPVTGETNDSLTGDYIWSRINVGEAISSVMTPFTGSFGLRCFRQFDFIPGVSLSGIIGGRVYANRSFEAYFNRTFGKLGRDLSGGSTGLAGQVQLPDDSERYVLRIGKGTFLFKLMPNVCSLGARHLWYSRNIPGFVANNPEWCRDMKTRISNTLTMAEMKDIWLDTIEPYIIRAFHRVIATAVRFSIIESRLRRRLPNLAGQDDVNILLSHDNQTGGFLESLGPVLGLSRVARGTMAREAFLQKWGHRGTHEIEVAAPRPFEEPGWLDFELEAFKRSGVNVDQLLDNKVLGFKQAWGKIEKGYPLQAKRLKSSLVKCSIAGAARESVRSEFIRNIWVVRDWARKTGKLSGIGDDVFFLTVDETLGLLSGDSINTQYIPARRLTFERYKSLPAYPSQICGRFDPFEWAKEYGRGKRHTHDENQNSTQAASAADDIISGVPGSPGLVTGKVRYLSDPEQSELLQDGEILVTSVTNIGWTLLFPRVKAVVTDIGAVLSHAAIVARELGIPAVVNCGNASERLHTGDLVKVDGTKGEVEIIERKSFINNEEKHS